MKEKIGLRDMMAKLKGIRDMKSPVSYMFLIVYLETFVIIEIIYFHENMILKTFQNNVSFRKFGFSFLFFHIVISYLIKII